VAQPRSARGFVGFLTRNDTYLSGPQVLSELRRVIVSGKVAPGSPIPLDEIAAFFGLSLIPVREAVKTLQGEGLLEHRPRLGYTVTALSPAELNELYVVRGALEAAAVEAAVRNSTPREHANARASHSAMADAVLAADIAGFQRASREFHEALLAPCRMPRLLHMISIAWNLTEPVQTMMRLTAQERVDMQRDHEEMLDAFTARDVDRAVSVGRAHHERLAACIARLPDTMA
jgi:DNA-binding GntR family transcriptional regulator